MPKHAITRSDIIDMATYSVERPERRRAVTQMKKNRRVHIGPDATFYFENFDTMLHQIHEMLHIEKGGEEQIKDELNAYATMVPNGSELVATLMFEIDEPVRRATFLGQLGGVEETVTIQIGSEVVTGIPETDIDRTNAEGKASSIQFLHFPFTAAQIAAFRADGAEVVVSIGHTQYPHMVRLSELVRQALAADFD